MPFPIKPEMNWFIFFAFVHISGILTIAQGFQQFAEQPGYQEVNPSGTIVLPCVIHQKRGECRWNRDGTPIGIYRGKYEWNGSPELGDCSLRVTNADREYDDGTWQCQVTPSSFSAKDALISEGGKLIVRERPTSQILQRIGLPDASAADLSSDLVASAGDDLSLECITTGGNPPAELIWFVGDERLQAVQEDERTAGTWTSVSRLVVPLSKRDDGSAVRCVVQHPTLQEPLVQSRRIVVHYPPAVIIETSSVGLLEEDKDSATLRCVYDSNPPSSLVWRKHGLEGILSREPEISFQPVTRHSAGVYTCTAENAVGLSEPALVELDVKYAPRILSVGPSRVVRAATFNKTVLTCEADGNPTPRIQWLQKLPTQEVVIRGYARSLVIPNTTYEHQGEFVCKAVNEIKDEVRTVQSDPVRVEVSGAPQIFSAKDLHVRTGEDAALEVLFCADPLPKQAWQLGARRGGDHTLILAGGTGHGRFTAEAARTADKPDCFVSVLRIASARQGDSQVYELNVSNEFGEATHRVRLTVSDSVSQESLIAVLVGGILTLLLLALVVGFACRKCCHGGNNGHDPKKADLESEKTDLDSSSSNLSDKRCFTGSIHPPTGSVIPPDAYYSSDDQYDFEIINNSKESLREASTPRGGVASSAPVDNAVFSRNVRYNDLCFPKTSNFGSMRRQSPPESVFLPPRRK